MKFIVLLKQFYSCTSKFFMLFVLLFTALDTIEATEVQVKNIRVLYRDDVMQTPISVNFDLKWKNSWNNAKNHDAVWVFMKYGTAWNNHVKIEKTGYKVLQNRVSGAPTPAIEVSDDGIGFFVYPSRPYRGDVNYKLQVLIDTTGRKIDYSQINGLSVHAIEMVYIPE